MDNSPVDDSVLDVKTFLLTYHTIELTEVYLDILDFLHELEYSVIDDQLSSLVSGYAYAENFAIVQDIALIFSNAIDYVMRQHGIVMRDDLPVFRRYDFIKALFSVADHEDKAQILAAIDSNDDYLEVIMAILHFVGCINPEEFLPEIDLVTDTCIENLRTYIITTLPQEEPTEENPAIAIARHRLGMVPDSVKESSPMYRLFVDGYPIGYKLTAESHNTLKVALSSTVTAAQAVNDARIFLLASELPDEELKRYFGFIIETMLPDDALTLAYTVNTVGY